ncbi:glucokinase [Clostridium saccharoperbutylacetonicum]|uniref:Transcriptional regulator/sugar kinase n=2 Tax=Clostridium TaxID=1485 RepID=M1N6H4_9CLOT|nr:MULTISPECIES: ROK family protein [Clostridium]AGF59012.1 transcriptional regulator/sugar kinase [Clostridium saccharoperbutylacetonicum N1-4(HMT)]NRT60200.1 glucokinase [Clostridium saccharoperbutylacetonicum]NSB23512.1 glucokinase [Clostridium saccharoperbutylacetonicum]NSB42882.1 glucokinase [Clostridium saccharoperbutylacetonicum]
MKNFMVFDIGGSSVKWSVINTNGEFVESNKFNVPENKSEFFNELSKITNEMKKVHYVKGIAISAPGAVDSETGIIGGVSAIPYIHGPNFKEILRGTTGLETELENDANCAALGECWLGAGKNNNDLAFVVCGSGIGGAIVKDKKIHGGTHKHGGEFGYCSITCDFEGEPKFTSWSQAGSTIALAKGVARLKGLEEGSLDGIGVFELCKNGDEIAIKEVNKYYFIMAVGIYNIQYTFDPEVIILGGAISEREEYIDEINKRLDILMNSDLEGTIKPFLKKCEFGNDANKLGALYNYLQRQE